jgi:polyisoprenyl-phosphate glycosyltransferase
MSPQTVRHVDAKRFPASEWPIHTAALDEPEAMNQSPEAQERTRPSRLSVVIPVYNEAGGVDSLLSTIHAALDGEVEEWEVVAVNDGSRDGTLDELLAAQLRHPNLVVVDLTRNFGKEAALGAALECASGDVVVPMDADLQDPPTLIPLMIQRWRQGFDVVLARRSDRSSDSLLKRGSASSFYRVMNRLAEVSVPANVGDFRLMDRKVVDAILALPENRRFMKGLFAWVGFRTTTVDYVRPERAIGSTKFNGWRLWNLAIEGITSFSIAPLKVSTYAGCVVAAVALVFASWIVIRTLVSGTDVPGYASLMTALLLMSGIQLLSIGVLGEYIGRIYMESKRRPSYLVRQVYGALSPVAATEDATSVNARIDHRMLS